MAKKGLVKRLFVYDKITGREFLVGTGSGVSVLPILGSKIVPSKFVLYAANGTKINTFGTKLITLNLGLKRKFQWPFILATVSKPILGDDFFEHYNLLVNMKRKKLLDDTSAVSLEKLISPYVKLLLKFSDITTPSQPKPLLHIQGWTLNFCDVATRRCRPFVPKEFRRLIFETLHNVSHPGVKTTVKLVGDRFLWPGYKKQVAEWTRCCVPCQRGKIQRHTDRLTKSLVPSYSGPHLAVPRASKRFNIQVGSRQETVSIDRLITAFQLAEIQPFRVSFSI
ncbi:hypothetical protein AVEN_81665-1 [Araneus ventricosus]|uniref:Integrase zinc-binding domain-containing protein n=1 Tax=Araneus ventricosus TaxID=182803 RepID=A0A4Y2U6W8_ARAVE|nr:hypothetical protein AVEN_81665-1 [Araneus ventricosus]